MCCERAVEFDGRWEGWRTVARSVLADRVSPDRVRWIDPWTTQCGLFAGSSTEAAGSGGRRGLAEVRVPAAFVTLGATVACHRDPVRWDSLYRALWRIAHGERHLLDVAADPLVARLRRLASAVRRDVHKMRAFVRFREVNGPDGESRWISWFEPDHRIVERNADFFVQRFTSMRFSIFTPDRSLHWDRTRRWFGAGASAHEVRGDDALESLWRTYYASTYNPARTRWKAMVSEMPVKYWKNLPEARLIPHLVRESEARVAGMLEADPVPDEATLRKRKRNNRVRRRPVDPVPGDGEP